MGDHDYSEDGSGDDPRFDYESYTSTKDSDSISLYNDYPKTYKELDSIRKMSKYFKLKTKNAMKRPPNPMINSSTGIMIDDSDFDYYMSDSSSSEDEIARIGYVGGTVKWEVGQKFVNMNKFRDMVRKCGIDERRGVHFVTNDKNRCQVVCAKDCSFYI